MILGDVEADARCGRGRRRWFRVESWKARARSSHRRGRCRASAVTGVPILPPTCTGTPAIEDVAGQAGGGGLAVGAGDADGAALEERGGEFDFADDRDAARAGGGERLEIEGHVGRRDDESASSKTAGDWTAKGMPRTRASSGSWSSGFRSVARTWAPSRRRSLAEATPDRFIPTTSARVLRRGGFNVSFASVAAGRAP